MSGAPTKTRYTAAAQRLQSDAWHSIELAEQSDQLHPDLAAHLQYFSLPQPAPNLLFSSGSLRTAATANLGWYRWQPLRPQYRAIVVHGYMDHTGLYGHLIRELLARNCEVLCFDLPGHGLSSGERASIDDFDHYQLALRAVLELQESWPSLPLVAFGQSTGGAILLQHLVENSATPSPWLAVNLFAPLFKPAGWRFNRYLLRWLSPWLKSIPRKFKPNSSDTQFNRFLSSADPLQTRVIPLQWLRAMANWIGVFQHHHCDHPVNIIQGDRDNTVAWRSNLVHFRSHFSAASITLIDGAGHQLVNERDALRKKIFAAIKI